MKKLIETGRFSWKLEAREYFTARRLQNIGIILVLFLSIKLLIIQNESFQEIVIRLNIILLFLIYGGFYWIYYASPNKKEGIVAFGILIIFMIVLTIYNLGIGRDDLNLIQMEMNIVAIQVLYISLFLYLLWSSYHTIVGSILQYLNSKTRYSFYITLLHTSIVLSFIFYITGANFQNIAIFLFGKMGITIAIYMLLLLQLNNVQHTTEA